MQIIDPTCSNCKHWTGKSNVIVEPGFGVCTAASDISNPSEQVPVGLNHAIVIGYGGYYAQLITGEDFCCNKWEPGNA